MSQADISTTPIRSRRAVLAGIASASALPSAVGIPATALAARLAADPIFDLARAESTRPDGSRETFRYEGKDYYSLVPAYSSDGGHLSERGQRTLGADLIRFVARAGKPVIVGAAPN